MTQPTQWKGVFPAATTQLNPDQSLDLDATARHLEILIQSGVHGIVMCGSLGENQTLLPEEKRDVVRMAISAVNKRVPVLSGVAENSTAAACAYVKDMENMGADGVMALPAMVYKADARETAAHFRAVAASTSLPIIVYNNPIGYHVDVTPAMFAELAEVENLVAIKESSADTTRITELFNTVGDRYAIFGGVDTLALECTLLGAVGWIAGVGAGVPPRKRPPVGVDDGRGMGTGANLVALVPAPDDTGHRPPFRAEDQAGFAGGRHGQ